ncbi:neutral/alkaline non-lysosomal ceramidase N-terminal domain-containing protein [Rhodopirellula sp. P2]|uniref:neutral/alkaline non-lysosomal ceramidase N-terminal domain-containing protein n=1 Tax=Rhodopirellula sp. P2 TaxID=2127060 RepID=UPI0023682E5C|nr:neutral/alkaline non-lysosomal ceramidase N-terminal domain-containing protein [Rhodopirellula sp. P2]WDQ18448.1 neutral/alkaline non-lysosomal ceramidase N-terminal domain-containing protein [Rhodopirellula sp. P2]
MRKNSLHLTETLISMPVNDVLDRLVVPGFVSPLRTELSKSLKLAAAMILFLSGVGSIITTSIAALLIDPSLPNHPLNTEDQNMLQPASLRAISPLLAIVFLLGRGPVLAAEDASPVFRAGAATSNITPPLGEMIVGGWKPIPATNVHDELHARCLVLDDGKVQLAIVLCDNVGIPVEVFDLAKQQASDATGLPASNMLLASTHTHSATTARGGLKTATETELTDYQAFVAHRISDGIRRAMANLEPARIGWGKMDEPSEVFNRRWFVTDASLLSNPFGGIDQVRMNPPRGSSKLDRPAGPTDPEISFVSVQSPDGRPIALLANYSLHYVGGVRSGEVSADYFGYFAKFIEEKLGASEQSPPFVGILSNGTSGDVNNINFSAKSPPKYGPYEKMQEVAGKVANRVFEAHQQIEFHDWVPLAAEHVTLTLKARQPTPEMIAYFEQTQDGNDDNPRGGHRREAIYADRIAKIQAGPKEVQIQLQALRIGELGIAAIPFETFTETGLELKDRSPFPDTFTIELANGSFGYLPTPQQHRLGGYETWLGSNYVEKEATTKIVAALLEMFQNLQEDD